MSRVKEKASHFIAFFFSSSYSTLSGCYSSASENVNQKKVQSGFLYMVREPPEYKSLRKPDFICFVFEKPTASQDIVSKICHQTESTFKNESNEEYSGKLGIHSSLECNSLTSSLTHLFSFFFLYKTLISLKYFYFSVLFPNKGINTISYFLLDIF